MRVRMSESIRHDKAQLVPVELAFPIATGRRRPTARAGDFPVALIVWSIYGGEDMPPSKSDVPALLTVNAGSSSIKWALFHRGASPVRTALGRIERIGIPDGIVTVTDRATGQDQRHIAQIPNHAAAVQILIDKLGQSGRGSSLQAIGHRVAWRKPLYESGSDLDGGHGRIASAQPLRS